MLEVTFGTLCGNTAHDTVAPCVHPNQSNCAPISPSLVQDHQRVYQNLDTFERYCFPKNMMSYHSLFYCEEHDGSLILIVKYMMIPSEFEKMHIFFVAKNGKK